jgi:hypothetical protein
MNGNVSTNNGPITITGDSWYNGTAVGIQSGSINAGGSGSLSISTSASNSANGIYINAGLATQGGAITLTSNTIDILGAGVNASTSGNITIRTNGALIRLGNLSDRGNLGLVQANLNLLSAQFLTIGSSSSNAIIISDAISWTGNLQLISKDTITQTVSGNLSVGGTACLISQFIIRMRLYLQILLPMAL